MHLHASKQTKNQDQLFTYFFKDAMRFSTSKGYQIMDPNLFMGVVRTFFFYAQNEYEKILRKIEKD